MLFRIRTIKTGGPLYVCTTHMQLNNPPLPFIVRVALSVDMGIGEVCHVCNWSGGHVYNKCIKNRVR